LPAPVLPGDRAVAAQPADGVAAGRGAAGPAARTQPAAARRGAARRLPAGRDTQPRPGTVPGRARPAAACPPAVSGEGPGGSLDRAAGQRRVRPAVRRRRHRHQHRAPLRVRSCRRAGDRQLARGGLGRPGPAAPPARPGTVRRAPGRPGRPRRDGPDRHRPPGHTLTRAGGVPVVPSRRPGGQDHRHRGPGRRHRRGHPRRAAHRAGLPAGRAERPVLPPARLTSGSLVMDEMDRVADLGTALYPTQGPSPQLRTRALAGAAHPTTRPTWARPLLVTGAAATLAVAAAVVAGTATAPGTAPAPTTPSPPPP